MARSRTDGRSIADRNREIRQEEHRRRIAESTQLTHIFGNIDKMQELAKKNQEVTDESSDKSEGNTKAIPVAQQIKNLETVNNQRFKLLAKILPDMKAIEVDLNAGLKVMEIDRTGIHDDDDPEEEAGD